MDSPAATQAAEDMLESRRVNQPFEAVRLMGVILMGERFPSSSFSSSSSSSHPTDSEDEDENEDDSEESSRSSEAKRNSFGPLQPRHLGILDDDRFALLGCDLHILECYSPGIANFQPTLLRLDGYILQQHILDVTL